MYYLQVVEKKTFFPTSPCKKKIQNIAKINQKFLFFLGKCLKGSDWSCCGNGYRCDENEGKLFSDTFKE